MKLLEEKKSNNREWMTISKSRRPTNAIVSRSAAHKFSDFGTGIINLEISLGKLFAALYYRGKFTRSFPRY